MDRIAWFWIYYSASDPSFFRTMIFKGVPGVFISGIGSNSFSKTSGKGEFSS